MWAPRKVSKKQVLRLFRCFLKNNTHFLSLHTYATFKTLSEYVPCIPFRNSSLSLFPEKAIFITFSYSPPDFHQTSKDVSPTFMDASMSDRPVRTFWRVTQPLQTQIGRPRFYIRHLSSSEPTVLDRRPRSWKLHPRGAHSVVKPTICFLSPVRAFLLQNGDVFYSLAIFSFWKKNKFP